MGTYYTLVLHDVLVLTATVTSSLSSLRDLVTEILQPRPLLRQESALQWAEAPVLPGVEAGAVLQSLALASPCTPFSGLRACGLTLGLLWNSTSGPFCLLKGCLGSFSTNVALWTPTMLLGMLEYFFFRN